MLLHDNLIKYTKIHINAQGILGTCSHTFDTNQKLTERSWSAIAWEVKKTVISIMYFSILWAQYFHARKHKGFAVALENIFFATQFSTFTFVKWLGIKRRKQLTASFNTFLEFESYQLEGSNQFCEDFTLKMYKIIIKSLIDCRYLSIQQLQSKTDTNSIAKIHLIVHDPQFSCN